MGKSEFDSDIETGIFGDVQQKDEERVGFLGRRRLGGAEC